MAPLKDPEARKRIEVLRMETYRDFGYLTADDKEKNIEVLTDLELLEALSRLYMQ